MFTWGCDMLPDQHATPPAHVHIFTCHSQYLQSFFLCMLQGKVVKDKRYAVYSPLDGQVRVIILPIKFWQPSPVFAETMPTLLACVLRCCACNIRDCVCCTLLS